MDVNALVPFPLYEPLDVTKFYRSSIAEDIGASLWTAIDGIYGTLIRKSDVFNIINTVVFEAEKRALSPLSKSDTSELSQGMNSVAISSQNHVHGHPTIPTADIPEYQGFLRLLSPTPTIGDDSWEHGSVTKPLQLEKQKGNSSPWILDTLPPWHFCQYTVPPLAKKVPPGISFPQTGRVSKNRKRGQRNRRNKKKQPQRGQKKATRPGMGFHSFE